MTWAQQASIHPSAGDASTRTGPLRQPDLPAAPVQATPAALRLRSRPSGSTPAAVRIRSAESLVESRFGLFRGSNYSTASAIGNTATPALYQMQRYSACTFQYQFSVPNGSSTVRLKLPTSISPRQGNGF